ncbi:hypothetical protein CHS0354_017457 [Potamilus streckersoni]|uniref:Transmembrane protein 232 n=1 Tax=Potamilus streckersoni TaxID=2493646 RepID=A0AAE0RQQ3_9BIVA|nr:hypothetical protein CHS0354_017457 [Potamilus streckersoni]
MPITKIPVIHKFGIISHSQRQELQERLLKQSYFQSLKSQRVVVPTRNPFEVTEEFVYQYNNGKSLDERDKYEEAAHTMLERCKRRAGLREGGEAKHANLPMAWTELAQLAQCKGKIQEECLDVLITSLDQSPMEKYHIPALFFLAETMLYWLRTDAVHQPYLRTGEIKLLKMGQLVFTRLFYHHMAGQLQGQQEFKNRLFTYLDGLSDCQEAYSPYPNALLSMRFIITVGKIVMADTLIEPGEVKEGDNVPHPKSPKSSYSRPSVVSQESDMKRSSHHDDALTTHSGAISSSVHDLSPTLWHALDVWRCTNQLGGGLNQALQALTHCGMGIVNENWVDIMIALQILSEAAKTNLAALKVLQDMARGVRPRTDRQTPPISSNPQSSETYSLFGEEESVQGGESQTSFMNSKPTLSDIYERSEEGESSRKARSSKVTTSREIKHDTSQEASPGALEESPDIELGIPNGEQGEKEVAKGQPKPALKEPSLGGLRPEIKEVSFDAAAQDHAEQSRLTTHDRVQMRTQDSKQSLMSRESGPPGTGWRAEAGTELHGGRASEATSVESYTNNPVSGIPGISGWHWEVAITYTNILADICLHGNSSHIQKRALMGNNRDLSDPFKRVYPSVPLQSAGLLDLAFFKPIIEANDGGHNDWSWRIRFGAIQSMVQICRCLANDKSREGIRTAAWNVLVKAHSVEKDDRVLEALKVGQVHTDIKSILNKEIETPLHTIGTKIAEGLSAIYLPPLPPPVEYNASPPRKKTPRKVQPTQREQPQEPGKKPLRTSLKEEIQLATALYEPPVSYNTRMSFDLHRIVEDQWRKDLQAELDRQEVERKKDLERKQKEFEELETLNADNKAKKFQKSKREEKK